MVGLALEQVVAGGLQRIFATAPWVTARLSPFAGSLIRLEITATASLLFRIEADGTPRWLVPNDLTALWKDAVPGSGAVDADCPPSDFAPTFPFAAAPDLTIRLPFSALPRLLQDPVGGLRLLHLQGNSGLAAEIGFLAQHFRPDLEELLSQVVGDVMAHQIGQGLRSGSHWLRRSVQRLGDAILEYGVEEARWLPARCQAESFARALTQLEQDVASLEQRLAELV